MARDLGAVWLGDNRCRFRVWAPLSESMHVHIVGPKDRVIPMEARDAGYHQATIDGAAPGTRYKYRLAKGKELPDPASRYQPEGVHGPSEVVDSGYEWNDRRWF